MLNLREAYYLPFAELDDTFIDRISGLSALSRPSTSNDGAISRSETDRGDPGRVSVNR